jgi:hypothetical protein
MGYVARSPAAFLDPTKRDRPGHRTLKPAVVQELIKKLNTPPAGLDDLARWYWQRNRMIILMLLFTGMRLAECASTT